jgi:hypothetical protein
VLPLNCFYIEQVLDWEKRIAGYSASVKAKYAKGFKKMDEFVAILAEDASKFKVTINDKKSGLLCEQRTSENGYPLVRMTIKYDYSCVTMWRASLNGDLRKKYDSNVAEVRCVEQIGTNLLKCYQRTKRIATVASRDVY